MGLGLKYYLYRNTFIKMTRGFPYVSRIIFQTLMLIHNITFQNVSYLIVEIKVTSE